MLFEIMRGGRGRENKQNAIAKNGSSHLWPLLTI